jgi:chromate reductase, NAD(P)H dehydrogenase (quinone)
MTPLNVAVLVGSLRAQSLTRKIAFALTRLAPGSLRCEFVEIGDLPLYNEDLEADTPAAWKNFRASIAAADAVLFVTPEYNRSIPGGLKNAIDVASRPFGKSVFHGKAGAVVSVTPGALGGFGANIAVRNSLVSLNVPMLPGPEAYIAGVRNLLDENGEIKAEASRAFLVEFMTAFGDWAQLIANRNKNG